jgi:hypothetical protein
MKRIELLYLLILLFLLVLVFGLNIYAGGTITSPQQLAIDLLSPPNTPQAWLIQDLATVKYRALFRLIVRGTWSAFFPPDDAFSFYLFFVGWSWLFFYGTVVALYYLLRQLQFDSRTSFIGCLLFLASPPVLLAYKYPVYTREDPLAYFLLTVGLIAVFRSRAFLAGLIAAAGALTRETTLILPLAYLFAARDAWRKRLFVMALPMLALIGIRILWGMAVGDNLESGLNNLRHPFETLAFMFCVFGVLWTPYVVRLSERWRRGEFENQAWEMLTASGPIILILMLGATLTISRAREARIAFILFPWAIPLALDWFRSKSDALKALAASSSFWVTSFSILALVSAVILAFRITFPDLMRDYLVDFVNGYWLILGTLHLSATLALFLPIRRREAITQGVG